MALNLEPCFTPVESPESNGMAEAFVKTFKRDYVGVTALPDADTELHRTKAATLENLTRGDRPHMPLKPFSHRRYLRAIKWPGCAVHVSGATHRAKHS